MRKPKEMLRLRHSLGYSRRAIGHGTLRRLVVMANSRKLSKRCIAAIDPDTGEWVRPVLGNRGIPRARRQINGREPRMLDIVTIPLGH